MTFDSDLHTHTVMSHGRGTAEEMVRAALQKGLRRIAITDHAPSHIFYGIRGVQKYLDTIHTLRDRYAGRIEVLAGMELNLVSLDGRTEMDETLRRQLGIAILGYHKLVWYKDLKSAWHFYAGLKRGTDVNTQSYVNAIRRNKIDILAHPGYGIALDHEKLAECCAENDVMVEINASHHEMTEDVLKVYNEAGVRFILSSDAHSAERVGEFGPAAALAAKAGVAPGRIVNAVL